MQVSIGKQRLLDCRRKSNLFRIFLFCFCSFVCIADVSCSNTWVIERRFTGDLIRNIPSNFQCGDSGVKDWYVNRTTGICQCMSTTPTFVVYEDGGFGCIRSVSACQGENIFFNEGRFYLFYIHLYFKPTFSEISCIKSDNVVTTLCQRPNDDV